MAGCPEGKPAGFPDQEMEIRLKDIYQRLYQHFGPRHWWPAETPLEVIVGAILTQNVAWKNVEKAITNLKGADMLSCQAIRNTPAEEIEPLIRSTGYYRVKTRKLKAFMDYLWERYEGSLERMFARPLSELRPEVLSVFGIGPETADAILCYAGGYPIMVMDAYTRRVFSRLGFLNPGDSYDSVQAFFMNNLPVDTSLYNEYHALIDRLANRVCTKKHPACHICPLADICPRSGLEES